MGRNEEKPNDLGERVTRERDQGLGMRAKVETAQDDPKKRWKMTENKRKREKEKDQTNGPAGEVTREHDQKANRRRGVVRERTRINRNRARPEHSPGQKTQSDGNEGWTS